MKRGPEGVIKRVVPNKLKFQLAPFRIYQYLLLSKQECRTWNFIWALCHYFHCWPSQCGTSGLVLLNYICCFLLCYRYIVCYDVNTHKLTHFLRLSYLRLSVDSFSVSEWLFQQVTVGKKVSGNDTIQSQVAPKTPSGKRQHQIRHHYKVSKGSLLWISRVKNLIINIIK